MKNTILNSMVEFGDKYGIAILIGAISAVIHKIRKNLSAKQFLGSIFISIIVSISISGVCACYFSTMPDTIVHIFCGIGGIFSQDILNELEETIKCLSDYIKMKCGIKDEIKTEE